MDQGVGRVVKRLREERGWSQAKLAVEADMSVSGVSMIESGQRNLTTTTLAKLAGALGIRIADFFKEEPEYTYSPKEGDPVGLRIRQRWLPSTLSDSALPIGPDLLQTRLGHAHLGRPVEEFKATARAYDNAQLLELLRALEAEEREVRTELGRQYRKQRRSREYKGRIRQLQHLFTTRLVALAEVAKSAEVIAEAEYALEEAERILEESSAPA